MTYSKWKKLYKAYKLDFDLELSLKLTRQRYSDIENVEDARENIVSF